MRIPFIAGNWKMFKTVQEAVFFIKELKLVVKDVKEVEIVVAPPFTAVHAVAEAARNTNIGVAAQNLYWEASGAFTGEVSGPMIKEAGAEYVIIGHSERRRLFGETDATVNRKVVAALAAGLTSIVCVGETLEERERERRSPCSIGRSRTASTASAAATSPSWWWHTSRSGRSAPAGTRRRRRPAKRMHTSASVCASGLAPMPPTAAT